MKREREEDTSTIRRQQLAATIAINIPAQLDQTFDRQLRWLTHQMVVHNRVTTLTYDHAHKNNNHMYNRYNKKHNY